MIQYEIKIDLIAYDQYIGNFERELTTFIFGAEWGDYGWITP
jgi:hypothetical protein